MPRFLTHSLSSELKGIGWMIAAAFWFSVMTAIVRHLSNDLHPFFIVLLRNGMALVAMLPWLAKKGFSVLRTKRYKMHLSRAVNGLFSMLLWFYSIAHIPMPKAIALTFTVPLFTTLLAIIFLGEKVGIPRWLAMCVGFSGTLVILQPGVGGFDPNTLIVLCSAVGWSTSNILIKSMTKTEQPHVIVFYMTLLMTPLSLPFALPYLAWPSLEEWGWFLLLGIISNWAQIALAHSYRHADMQVVLPFDFTRLIFASVIAYMAFGDTITVSTVIGSVIILGSAVYITHREARAKRRLAESGR